MTSDYRAGLATAVDAHVVQEEFVHVVAPGVNEATVSSRTPVVAARTSPLRVTLTRIQSTPWVATASIQDFCKHVTSLPGMSRIP
jgi:hypothetical protein